MLYEVITNDGGYAVTSYRQVDQKLGTMDELKTLASELRENGISLVLDVVYNHTADNHEWAIKAQQGDRNNFVQHTLYEVIRKEFEASISIRVEGGDAPDIADFPQPGLLASFVASGDIVDVSKYLDMDALKANYNQSWLDMAMMDSPDGEIMSGVWHRVNGKSLVWYPKDDFDAAGYTIPTTWEELLALIVSLRIMYAIRSYYADLNQPPNNQENNDTR